MVNFLLNFRYMVHTLAPYTFLPADLISVSATRLVISASRLGASIYDVCAQGGALGAMEKQKSTYRKFEWNSDRARDGMRGVKKSEKIEDGCHQ